MAMPAQPRGCIFAELIRIVSNVSECVGVCTDWFSPAYHSQGMVVNPTGPSTGTSRSIRGGTATDPISRSDAKQKYA